MKEIKIVAECEHELYRISINCLPKTTFDALDLLFFNFHLGDLEDKAAVQSFFLERIQGLAGAAWSGRPPQLRLLWLKEALRLPLICSPFELEIIL